MTSMITMNAQASVEEAAARNARRRAKRHTAIKRNAMRARVNACHASGAATNVASVTSAAHCVLSK